MAVVTLIPKCILEEEDLTTLRDMGIEFEDGSITINKCKVNCIKVINLTETQIFDRLDSHSLLESAETERNSYVQRAITVLFMKLRLVSAMTDKDQKLVATCALMGAVNSLALMDTRAATRFLALIRGLN